jgi:predicted ABC-type ATPase
VPPSVIALAGPNGAGKSTAGPALLKETLGIAQFVNADVIAQGLSAFAPESAALAAGKILLARLRELAASRVSFAFETTLAGRSCQRWLTTLISEGYSFHIIYLWLPNPAFAVARVKDRVRRGGHAIPESTIRRRFATGLRNFFAYYQEIAESWRIYDSSGSPPRLVATGRGRLVAQVDDEATWTKIQQTLGESPDA